VSLGLRDDADVGLKPGGGLPGTGIGSITAAAYQCPTVFGPSYKLTPLGLPWRLNLTSYDAGTGVSRGTITHVRIAFSVFTCSAVIAGASATSGGQVTVSYASQAGTLKILTAGSTLHWYRVHKCAHVVADGDPVALSASYAISPLQTITSPAGFAIPGGPVSVSSRDRGSPRIRSTAASSASRPTKRSAGTGKPQREKDVSLRMLETSCQPRFFRPGIMHPAYGCAGQSGAAEDLERTAAARSCPAG
jgi:hypothetical protein